MSRRRAQAGFTLIELMVAMVVSAIVVLGVYAFSAIQQSTAGLHERNVRVQQALEGAMWTMAQDVRSAGLGHARICSELRVWDSSAGLLINPGAVADPTLAVRDAVTGEAYWVLRDGLQAHWNSSIGGDLPGDVASSASPQSVADSFDVILGDDTYTGSYGVFQLAAPIGAADTTMTIRSSAMLSNADANHVAQVQQLLP
ncbi:PilW family protein, partial [Paraliomyxa miuraensis]|uniref:PilW family protein n=2 Tax=Paraliomyxa miuraensis TaxID=376150 RepID=UPI00224CB95C